MTQKVQILRSNTAGHTPGTLLPGELAVNTADKKLWAGDVGTGAPLDVFATSLITAAGGTAPRTLPDRGRDVLSAKDFGATGNGVTDDTAAVAAAAAAGWVLAPQGTYKVSTTSASVSGSFQGGRGQVLDGSGNKHAPFLSVVSAAPASLGNWDFIDTAFNGDISRVQFPIEHRVNAFGALPTTGYQLKPELSCKAEYGLINTSVGGNTSTATNDGRTGIVHNYTQIYHAGQGDGFAQYTSVYVADAKPGATSWLANPAGCAFGAQITAGANGVFLQGLGDIDLNDNGFAAAGIGLVINMDRTNAGQTLGQVWSGARLQSIGAQPVDSFYSMMGPAKIGTDYVGGAFTNGVAVAMSAGQRIYGNATNPNPGGFSNATLAGTEWVEYAGSNWQFVIGGAAKLQVSAAGLTTYGPVVVLPATGTNAVQLVGAVSGQPAVVQTYDSASANAQLLLRGQGTGGLLLGDGSSRVGFYGFSPQTKPSVTGSRGGNAALASLLSALSALGLVTDSTTA